MVFSGGAKYVLLTFLTKIVPLRPIPLFHRFRMDCKAAGKKVMVWTVNDPERMMEVCDKQ
jgi:hypothetical protein